MPIDRSPNSLPAQAPAPLEYADTRQKGGRGLGLSITRILVEEHGGRISFETAPGVGTTFMVDVPPCVGAQPAQGSMA